MASWPGWRLIDALVAVGFTAEYITRIIVAPDGRGDEAAEEDGRRPQPAPSPTGRLPAHSVDLPVATPYRQPPPASACQAQLQPYEARREESLLIEPSPPLSTGGRRGCASPSSR